MKRASSLLETARLDKELDYTEISHKTKIPVRYLRAFETEDKSAFPEEPYCSLMVREYASFLGLNPEEVVCLFRRDYDRRSNKTGPSLPFSITPQFTYTFLIILSLIVFSVYLISEYIKFHRPPHLAVSWPTPSSKIIEIKGQTDPESTIKINQDLVVVDVNGNFSKSIELSTPEAKVTVEAKSPSGKSTVLEKIYK